MKKVGFQYAHQYLNISPSSGRAPPGALRLSYPPRVDFLLPFTTPFCIESYMVDGFLCWNADSPCSFSVVLPINLLLLLYSLASC